jgi:ferredoxin
MKIEVEVDKSLCIGCGSCEAQCSEVFKLGEDGHAEVLESGLKKVEAGELDCDLEEIADNCPAQAITVKKNS